jgi:hypothetical protein
VGGDLVQVTLMLSLEWASMDACRHTLVTNPVLGGGRADGASFPCQHHLQPKPACSLVTKSPYAYRLGVISRRQSRGPPEPQEAGRRPKASRFYGNDVIVASAHKL